MHPSAAGRADVHADNTLSVGIVHADFLKRHLKENH